MRTGTNQLYMISFNKPGNGFMNIQFKEKLMNNNKTHKKKYSKYFKDQSSLLLHQSPFKVSLIGRNSLI